jgi:hypothetical protein
MLAQMRGTSPGLIGCGERIADYQQNSGMKS